MARKINKPSKSEQIKLNIKSDCTALYLRVSSERQVKEGNGLDVQLEKLTRHCELQGWHVCPGHIYRDEGISGKSADNREALQAMLKAADAGLINRIVVTKFDRLARNTRDLLEIFDRLNKVSCALVILDLNIDTGTPVGKMMATIMGSLAEWERTLIGERVMSGKRQQTKSGEYNGSRIPLGYNYDGKTWEVNEHATTIQRIFDEFNQGKSLNAIATRLQADSVPTSTGAAWGYKTVQYILSNGFYAGVMQYDGVEVDVTHPVVIDRHTYESAHGRLLTLRRGRPA